ncbi:hypothetical protein QM312_21100 [Burkholderia cenocepacia]|uniref:hypothetical protein n=1 Tax=Burkholderia cenocepacia TaxID=95486 RepID=UPI0024B6EDDC|nr:hypothetical protein [Burkholderia cenocepacia]MDI9698446.1 hypothetical protein [Burkholderia cenocepacia]MDN7548203.1 hypothetical protein [Burkholderia cenocepacia]
MAFYLRDQSIENVSIDGEAIKVLNGVFVERSNQLIAEFAGQEGKNSFLSYIIRFDNKGYRVFSVDELLAYFHKADHVERVIFTVESSDALASGRVTGAYLELFLDGRDPNRCLLQSTSDKKDWAEASFAAVHEVLGKYKTRYGLLRNDVANFLIQISGITAGFILSLWLASKVAPNLKMDNPFVISLLFILLIFSNIWGYAARIIQLGIFRRFPNVEFVRPEKARLHWIYQALIGSFAFSIVVYVAGQGVSFVSKVLGGWLGSTL